MENITYLMGAGASYNSLPIYKNFKERFELFGKTLEGSMGPGLSESHRRSLDNLIQDCRNLQSEFAFHNTPDTIAKKYFHLQSNGLERLKILKAVLVTFFIYEQSVSEEFIKNTNLKEKGKSQLDKRYDAFIASILETKYSTLNINPRINILTWNYDLQFEICYKNYCQKDFPETQLEIQSIPSVHLKDPTFRHDNSRFSIVHLNGIAYCQIKAGGNTITPFTHFHTHRQSLIVELLDYYHLMRFTEVEGGFLNFAWERDPSFPKPKEILEATSNAAKTIASKTTVLVIIGYSFPIFNRLVDSALFKEMKQLKRIYIQSPDGEDLKSRIIDVFGPLNNKIVENEIRVVTSVDQFYLPAELDHQVPEPVYWSA